MLFATTWIDLEIVVLSKVSQTEKERYCVTSLLCEIYKKDDTNVMVCNLLGKKT